MATPSIETIAHRLQAMAQTGLTYTNDEFDIARYQELMTLAADLLAPTLGVQAAELTPHFRIEAGYATPKVDVRGAVIRRDRILLVREKTDDRWALPGGWADVGQSPSESVVREVWEEAGLRTTATRLLGVWDRSRHDHPPHLYHIFKMFFLCQYHDGEPVPGAETSEALFFSPSRSPPLSLGRTLPKHIEWIFRMAADAHAPPYFD